MQQSDAERENKECAYDQEEEKKAILKSSLRFEVFMTSSVGLDGRGSKGAMCHEGQTAPFQGLSAW